MTTERTSQSLNKKSLDSDFIRVELGEDGQYRDFQSKKVIAGIEEIPRGLDTLAFHKDYSAGFSNESRFIRQHIRFKDIFKESSPPIAYRVGPIINVNSNSVHMRAVNLYRLKE